MGAHEIPPMGQNNFKDQISSIMSVVKNRIIYHLGQLATGREQKRGMERKEKISSL